MASPVNSPPIAAVLLLLLLLCSSMAAPPEPASECVSELVTFSPCLAFVSAPPNNLSNTVSRDCCSAFSATLSGDRNGGGGGGGACLCYLLRQPLMLGFPLNQNRVLDLPSSCDLDDQSLETLCSVSEATSPSQNETNSRISNPPDSAPSSQPSPSSSPESDNSAKPPSSVNDTKTTTGQAPPPETTPRQPLPTRPRPAAQTPSRLPSLFSSTAPAHRSRAAKIWSETGIITTIMVLSSHQLHLSSNR